MSLSQLMDDRNMLARALVFVAASAISTEVAHAKCEGTRRNYESVVQAIVENNAKAQRCSAILDSSDRKSCVRRSSPIIANSGGGIPQNCRDMYRSCYDTYKKIDTHLRHRADVRRESLQRCLKS